METLVPIEINGQKVLLSAREICQAKNSLGEEREISDRQPKFDKVLIGLTQFTQKINDAFAQTDASKVTVEFGCEFALESGSFIAVIGKVSSKSTLKIGLEWVKSAL